MTRRNLSDILRQEVQKEALGTDLEETKPRATSSDKKGTATSSRARKATAATSKQENPTSDTLLVDQVAELKLALSQGVDHEKKLQDQVKVLQTEVSNQKKEVSRLEAQVTQNLQLKAELAEAKDLILKLSEENTQLNQTLEQLKTPKVQPKWKGTLSIKPLPSHVVQQGKATDPAKQPSSKSVDVGWMD